jgi:hypothetical protein
MPEQVASGKRFNGSMPFLRLDAAGYLRLIFLSSRPGLLQVRKLRLMPRNSDEEGSVSD